MKEKNETEILCKFLLDKKSIKKINFLKFIEKKRQINLMELFFFFFTD